MAAGAEPIPHRRRALQYRRFELVIGLGELFEPERSIGRTEFRGPAIPVARLGRVGMEVDDTEPLQHDGIVSSTERQRRLRIIPLGCPAQHQTCRCNVAGRKVGARTRKQGRDFIAIGCRNGEW